MTIESGFYTYDLNTMNKLMSERQIKCDKIIVVDGEEESVKIAIRDGVIEITCDGQMVVNPKSSNRIQLRVVDIFS